ncbi:MAG: adenylate kinase family protein [Candidatus Makana argininalis]
MNIIIIGAPGSGKGTQSQLISKKYGIKHICTSNLIRNSMKKKTKYKNNFTKTISSGRLLNDAIVISFVKSRITKQDCKNGFVLDGFPRTYKQAISLKKLGIKFDYIIFLSIKDKTIIDRIVYRKIHIPSGRIYNSKFNPPKVEGKDDITGDLLITRNDDKKNILNKRLIEYHKNNNNLLNFYYKESLIGNNNYYIVDASKNKEEIINNIFNKINYNKENK